MLNKFKSNFNYYYSVLINENSGSPSWFNCLQHNVKLFGARHLEIIFLHFFDLPWSHFCLRRHIKTFFALKKKVWTSLHQNCPDAHVCQCPAMFVRFYGFVKRSTFYKPCPELSLQKVLILCDKYLKQSGWKVKALNGNCWKTALFGLKENDCASLGSKRLILKLIIQMKITFTTTIPPQTNGKHSDYWHRRGKNHICRQLLFFFLTQKWSLHQKWTSIHRREISFFFLSCDPSICPKHWPPPGSCSFACCVPLWNERMGPDKVRRVW